MFKIFLKNRQNALLLIILIIMGLNTVTTVFALSKNIKRISSTAGFASSDIFNSFNNSFKKTSRAGFVSDLSVDDAVSAAAAFALVQYAVIPTILELDRKDFPFVIYSYSNPFKAIKQIKKEGMIFIKAAPNGVILAANPDPDKK